MKIRYRFLLAFSKYFFRYGEDYDSLVLHIYVFLNGDQAQLGIEKVFATNGKFQNFREELPETANLNGFS